MAATKGPEPLEYKDPGPGTICHRIVVTGLKDGFRIDKPNQESRHTLSPQSPLFEGTSPFAHQYTRSSSLCVVRICRPFASLSAVTSVTFFSPLAMSPM